MNDDLLFHNAYESFYSMTSKSIAFSSYCKDAFGADFSQDGFSDIDQINLILNYIPKQKSVHVLDVGCGNGKMLKYLQDKTGCHIYGFDYSKNAIEQASLICKNNSHFQVAVIDEVIYPSKMFDVVTSMDSIYFSKNMNSFVYQVNRWLKPGGYFIIGYQEGDIMPRTRNCNTTEISKSLNKNHMNYSVLDITNEVYQMLRRKRDSVIKHENEFVKEGILDWFELVLQQTECVNVSLNEYKKYNARYIYIAIKSY